MNDEQLDDLLRHVRPAGPPPELRARILGARRSPRAWPWAVAAAALLALTVGLQVSTMRTSRAITRAVAPVQAEGSDLTELRAALEDDELLLRQAEALTEQDQREANRAETSAR